MLSHVLRLGTECGISLCTHINMHAVRSEAAIKAFQLASYLTQPICDMHKHLRLVWTIEPLNPEASKLANYARQAFQYLKVGAFGVLGAIPAVFGIALRKLGSEIQKDPWIYIKGSFAKQC